MCTWNVRAEALAFVPMPSAVRTQQDVHSGPRQCWFFSVEAHARPRPVVTGQLPAATGQPLSANRQLPAVAVHFVRERPTAATRHQLTSPLPSVGGPFFQTPVDVQSLSFSSPIQERPGARCTRCRCTLEGPTEENIHMEGHRRPGPFRPRWRLLRGGQGTAVCLPLRCCRRPALASPVTGSGSQLQDPARVHRGERMAQRNQFVQQLPDHRKHPMLRSCPSPVPSCSAAPRAGGGRGTPHPQRRRGGGGGGGFGRR